MAKRTRWGQLASLCDAFPSADLIENTTILGRNAAADGTHCIITRECPASGEERVYVVDKSLNGTFVDNTRIPKGVKTLLNSNSELCISRDSSGEAGRIKFLFRSLGVKPPTIEDAYTLGETLGTGAFAVVKRCTHIKTKEVYAVKIVDKRKLALVQSTRDLVKAEVDILRRIRHPNIVKFQDLFDSKRYLYIVLEFVDGGELFDKIIESGRFKEVDAKALFRQLAKGIDYLHTRNISHRDLKPENILLKKEEYVVPGSGIKKFRWRVKISDFGMSRFVGNMGCNTMAGTPQYLAPEIISSAQGGQGAYNERVDMWSLGVILYILLSGTQPFSSGKGLSVMEQILQGKYDFPKHKFGGVSDQAIGVIRRLLTVDPKHRLTARQLLEHPWLRKHGRPITPRAPPPGVPSGASSTTLRFAPGGSSDGVTTATTTVSSDGKSSSGAGGLLLGASATGGRGTPTGATAAGSGVDADRLPSGVGFVAPSATNGTAAAGASPRPRKSPGTGRRVRIKEPSIGSGAGAGAGAGAGGDAGAGGGGGSTPRRRRRSQRSAAADSASTGTGGGRTQSGGRGSPNMSPRTASTVSAESGASNPFRKRGRAGAGAEAGAGAAAGAGGDEDPGTPSRRRRRKSKRARPRDDVDDEDEGPADPKKQRMLECPPPVVRQQKICPYGKKCYRTRNPKHVTEFFHPHLAA